VASEYSVNIRLNTEQVRKDLRDIKSDIDKLGKVNLGTNQKTQRTEAQITKSKLAQRVAMAETRRVGDLVQKAADQGLKVARAREAVDKSSLLNSKKEFKESKAVLKLALDELKIQKAISKEKAQQAALASKTASNNAKAMAGGPFISTGIASSRFGSVGQAGSPRFIASRAGMMQGPANPPYAPGMFGSSPIGGSRFMFGSPAQIAFSGSGMGRSSLRGNRFQFGSPAFFDAAARAGGQRSPIGGSRFTFGSPAFNAAQGIGAPRVPIGGRSDLVGSPANLLSIGKQNAMPVKGFEFLVGSPAYYEAQNKEILRVAKQNAVPVKGFKHLVGSPAYLEDQAKQLKKLRGAPTGFRAAEYGPQQPMQGPMFPTGAAKPLNFDSRGNLLPGPLGSKQTRAGLMRTLSRNRGPAFQSAAISGAFPLLFGQGPLAAAGGALGGGLGGAFGGQMGGFAGGLIGTAVVSGIQNAVAGVAELGKAFNSVTPNIEALTGALGIAGTEEEKRLQLIQKQQGAQAALSQVTQKMNELIGENGVKELKQFGDNARLLGNAFAEAVTKMRAAIAPLLNMLAKPFTGQLSRKEQERLAGVGGAATDETLLGLEEELGGIRSTKQNRAKRNRIKARIADRKEELALFGQSIERANNLKLIENDLVRKNRQKNELLQATIDGNKEQVQLSQDIAAEVQRRLDAGFAIIEIDIKDIENQVKKTKELEKQAAIAEQIEQSFKDMVGTIATDLSDGIKGLIRGTSTLNEVMNSVLDKMIDAAFNMAFFGNAGGQLIPKMGLFGNLFGGLLANGGPAKAGKSYIVGERGPEIFTPGVSGMVSPNSALGGSTNIVVNVDASGSSVQGDEQQGRELGRIISVAVQSEIIQQQRPGGLLA